MKIKFLLICALASFTLLARSQTNTNIVTGFVYPSVNTNAVPYIIGGRFGYTTNNYNTNFVLFSGTSNTVPRWKAIDYTNIVGTPLNATNVYSTNIVGGLTTNYTVIHPGPITNTLLFTNGILIGIQ